MYISKDVFIALSTRESTSSFKSGNSFIFFMFLSLLLYYNIIHFLFHAKNEISISKKEKNSSFFILKTSYFIIKLPFLNVFTELLCTNTASLLLICTEKPRPKLLSKAKRQATHCNVKPSTRLASIMSCFS